MIKPLFEIGRLSIHFDQKIVNNLFRSTYTTARYEDTEPTLIWSKTSSMDSSKCKQKS